MKTLLHQDGAKNLPSGRFFRETPVQPAAVQSAAGFLYFGNYISGCLIAKTKSLIKTIQGILASLILNT